MFFGHVDRFLRRKAVVLLAFLVMVSMWAFQDSVLLKVRPRYLALFVCFSWTLWMWYVALMVLRLLEILISSHLSGLKCICQSASQSCSLLRSSCRDSTSARVHSVLNFIKTSIFMAILAKIVNFGLRPSYI